MLKIASVDLSRSNFSTFYFCQTVCSWQWHTQEFFSGGVKQIQLRTEGRENGDLGVVAP